MFPPPIPNKCSWTNPSGEGRLSNLHLKQYRKKSANKIRWQEKFFSSKAKCQQAINIPSFLLTRSSLLWDSNRSPSKCPGPSCPCFSDCLVAWVTLAKIRFHSNQEGTRPAAHLIHSYLWSQSFRVPGLSCSSVLKRKLKEATRILGDKNVTFRMWFCSSVLKLSRWSNAWVFAVDFIARISEWSNFFFFFERTLPGPLNFESSMISVPRKEEGNGQSRFQTQCWSWRQLIHPGDATFILRGLVVLWFSRPSLTSHLK